MALRRTLPWVQRASVAGCGFVLWILVVEHLLLVTLSYSPVKPTPDIPLRRILVLLDAPSDTVAFWFQRFFVACAHILRATRYLLFVYVFSAEFCSY